MIYVTHDQVEAMTMGDHICVMRDGLIMQVADPLTLYLRPGNLFVAGFIGSPPMNLLKGKVTGLVGMAPRPSDSRAMFTFAVPIPHQYGMPSL